MDQFPTGFFGEVALEALHVIIHVGLGVPRIVLPQRPHQDDGDQARQEDDHHEGVEDGEPVDLAKGGFPQKRITKPSTDISIYMD